MPCRRAIDQLLDMDAAASEPAAGWQRFTSTATPGTAAQQARPGSGIADAAPDVSWRRTSDAALHLAKVAWGQPAAAVAQASPGSGAWPAAPRAAAKAGQGHPLASPVVAKHCALPTSTRACSATHQQRPLQPARRSLTGALTPAAAWDRLCRKPARPGAGDESVWVAGGSTSSLEDSDWDARSSDDGVRLNSSPESSISGRESRDGCSGPPPQSTQAREGVSPVAIARCWKEHSRRKRLSAAPLPVEPVRSQATQHPSVQPSKLRRVQAVGRDSSAPGALQSGGHAAGGACQAVDSVGDEVDSPPASPTTSAGTSQPADGIMSDADDGPSCLLSGQPDTVCGRKQPGSFVNVTSKASWVQARTGAASHRCSKVALRQTLLI